MQHVEPFQHYSSIKRGKPFLSLSLNGKNGFVQWNDGTLNDDRLFRTAVSPELIVSLRQIWNENQTNFSKKAEMFRGGQKGEGGSVAYFPSHLALRVHSLVLMHFDLALQLMLDCGIHSGPLFWDTVQTIHDRILAERYKINQQRRNTEYNDLGW